MRMSELKHKYVSFQVVSVPCHASKSKGARGSACLLVCESLYMRPSPSGAGSSYHIIIA